MHLAIFKSHSSNPEDDPVVYLEGGPGGYALELVPLIYEHTIAPFLSKRDFVIFDQRGVGYSEPSLQCSEIPTLLYELLDRNLDDDEELERTKSALKTCRARLTASGVNIQAYTSSENAADLAHIKEALHIDQWNLYGSSYGTRLALTAMRDFPDGIRSVILDSTYPLQVDAYASELANAKRSLDLLFDH